MESQSNCKSCLKHQQAYKFICLDEDCEQNFLLCQTCYNTNIHKHSKTTIEDITQIRNKLMEKWDHEVSSQKCRDYVKKVRDFYQKMRKQIIQVINEDQRIAEQLINKLSYHHLPFDANSLTYSEFKNYKFSHIDKHSLLKLIQQAQNGEINKNLDQQNEIINLIDVQLTKSKQKIMSLKYVLLSKKIQAQILTPKLKQASKISQVDELSKIYALFNSKNLVIRSAKLIYCASDSGFSDKKFYNSCNNQLNTLTLIKLANNRKVGGFSTIPLVYHDQDLGCQQGQIRYARDTSKRNFIFNLTNLSSFQIKNNDKALIYKSKAIGPIFGEDLNILNREAESNLGTCYQCPQGVEVNSLQAKVYLLGGGKVKVEEMEIWQLSF